MKDDLTLEIGYPTGNDGNQENVRGIIVLQGETDQPSKRTREKNQGHGDPKGIHQPTPGVSLLSATQVHLRPPLPSLRHTTATGRGGDAQDYGMFRREKVPAMKSTPKQQKVHLQTKRARVLGGTSACKSMPESLVLSNPLQLAVDS